MKTINVELSKNKNIINSHIILIDIFFKDNISLFNERNNENKAVIIYLKNTEKINLILNFKNIQIDENIVSYLLIFFFQQIFQKKYVKKSIIIKK